MKIFSWATGPFYSSCPNQKIKIALNSSFFSLFLFLFLLSLSLFELTSSSSSSCSRFVLFYFEGWERLTWSCNILQFSLNVMKTQFSCITFAVISSKKSTIEYSEVTFFSLCSQNEIVCSHRSWSLKHNRWEVDVRSKADRERSRVSCKTRRRCSNEMASNSLTYYYINLRKMHPHTKKPSNFERCWDLICVFTSHRCKNKLFFLCWSSLVTFAIRKGLLINCLFN